VSRRCIHGCRLSRKCHWNKFISANRHQERLFV